VHAALAATGSRSRAGNGTPSSQPRSRGASNASAATAANDSCAPTSSTVHGFQPTSSRAAHANGCQTSCGREASHASATSTPATPARSTDGDGPTTAT
jgi:hypothetical protein